MIINWSDPNHMVSKYFSVRECLWLQQWGRMATESDGLTDEIKTTIINFCFKMDVIREYLFCPINVHCLYRPPAYSVLVGGTVTDSHTHGNGMDWDCMPVMSCFQAKPKLRPMLEEWKIRMENNGDRALWIHTDSRPPGPSGWEFIG